MMSRVRNYVIYKLCNFRTYVTNKYAIFFLSEQMLHTKICNIRTYVIHETEMYSVRKYVAHEGMMFSVQLYITYENM